MSDIGKRFAYHLLYEQAHGKARIQQINEIQTAVYLPSSKVTLPIDYRNKNTLVVFDGFVLFGGLPKNTDIVYRSRLNDLSVNIKSVRGTKSFLEEEMPDVYCENDSRTGKTEVFAKHWRYFLLLPTCRAVVFRYRPKSLSPQGVVIEVKDGRAEFKTTSY